MIWRHFFMKYGHIRPIGYMTGVMYICNIWKCFLFKERGQENGMVQYMVERLKAGGTDIVLYSRARFAYTYNTDGNNAAGLGKWRRRL